MDETNRIELTPRNFNDVCYLVELVDIGAAKVDKSDGKRRGDSDPIIDLTDLLPEQNQDCDRLVDAMTRNGIGV